MRLDAIRLLDLRFLHGCQRPTLCILYEDNRRARHVKTFIVDAREKELTPGPWLQNNVEHNAQTIIPVPSPSNGIILLGETTITYIGGSDRNIQAVAIQPTHFCAFGVIEDGKRYLLGDIRGNLFVLVVCHDKSSSSGGGGLSASSSSSSSSSTVTSLVVDSLGVTALAESLSYLDNGVVFVGSIYGDSQLIKLRATPDEAGSYVELLEKYMNLGPIVDMVVVASERQGQCQVVTCSGGYKEGSLRVVRSGIGIHEQASLEAPGIKGQWSLRLNERAQFDKFLVQAYIGETRVLSIDNEEMSEAEITGFDCGQQSLYCGNMIGGYLVQVTSLGARLVDAETRSLVFEFASSSKVTVASGNLEQLVLALGGGEVLYLEVDANSKTLIQRASVKLDQDVACISVRPLRIEAPSTSSSSSLSSSSSSSTSADDGKIAMSLESTIFEGGSGGDEFPLSGRSNILVLGMWTDNSVRLLALPTLQELTRVHLGVETQTRDALLVALITGFVKVRIKRLVI